MKNDVTPESPLDWAVFYHDRGWSVVPVVSGQKRPSGSWKKYQFARASRSELRAWFDPARGGQYSSLGIVLGPVSGGVAVRDFDDAHAYDEWAENYSGFSETLPTVRTAKGCHVYYKHPKESTLSGIQVYRDGELRISGGIVVVPPSLHPSGSRYEWIIPLPDRDILEIDPGEIGLIGTCPEHAEMHKGQADNCIPMRHRNSTLTSLAGAMRRQGAGEAAILAALREENTARCDPPLPDIELVTIARSVSRYEPAQSATRSHPSERYRSAEPVIVNLGDVAPEEVSWLWPAYIPKGKLTILEGDPGVGKTTVALNIAGMVTRGDPFPDVGGGIGQRRKPANVVYLSAEDGLGDTLRPRLDAAGADVTRVYALTGMRVQEADGTESTQAVTLQDIAVLDAVLEEFKPELVVVDPLQAYLGSKVDMHRANETRPILAALAALAEKHKCAVLCIRHLGKSTQERAVYRGLGSIDFAAAARSILLAALSPTDPSIRVLAHVKSSLSKEGKSLGYRLENGCFYWVGIQDISAEDLLRAPLGSDDRSAVDEAASFLEEVLQNGSVLSNDIKREARRLKISSASLRRAKGRLDIKVSCQRSVRGKNEWYWSLPTAPEQAPPDVSHEQVEQHRNGQEAQEVGPAQATCSLEQLTLDQETQLAHVSNMDEQG